MNTQIYMKPSADVAAASIAATIRDQLGGNRFEAMTGAKHFTRDGKGSLTFKLPRGARNGINLVTIELDPSDTYTVSFAKYRGLHVRAVSMHCGVYADQLRRVFTEATGLDTSL